ncbi:exosortase N [Cytophagaceae bacterium YF14B1]|uniref:Exosortase N n=1 Tax=Xanthocytophaga flava TaxID=3048013 RepID=A0AAE3QIQ7_9BACT|nr:exosortase N [Xanthocytophaga flavus]MDJ1480052.1 exosortase N [Xanthocytophaga flavus]
MNPKVAIALLKYAIQSNDFSIGKWIRSDYRRSTGIALITLYILFFGYLVSQTYFTLDSLSWFGIVLFPYILIIRQSGIYSSRYGWLLMAILGCMIWLPARTLPFGLLTIGILFIIEFTLGKTTLLPFLLIGVLSPFFRYTSIIFSFPIRLQLSKWAGAILSAGGFENTISGNAIQVEGTEFLVDVACMGLQMTETSLLMTIFLIAYNERTQQRYITNSWVIGLGIVTLFLNSLSNLFRILILIVFHILPSNPMHDVVGLVCLVAYVILPMVFITQWIYKKRSKLMHNHVQTTTATTHRPIFISTGFALIVLVVLGIQLFFNNPRPVTTFTHITTHLAGFTKQQSADDITQFINSSMLVYIKPIPTFYVAEHSPLICWQGSGYTFKRVEMKTIDNALVYTGILQKGQDRIYTAWWFDNGSHRTTDQMDWRWRMAQGEPAFCLVNVNVNKQEELANAVRQIFKQKLFR